MSQSRYQAARSVMASVLLAATGWSFSAMFAAQTPPPTPSAGTSPRPEPRQLDLADPADPHLDKTAPRRTKGLDLVKMGWSYDCMECHRLIPAKWRYDRPMVEHAGIRLNHGNNRFCLNCHHPANRNAFVDYDGTEIAEADVVLLCAKCHGTTHRDWQAGVHGRKNGFWDKSKGPQVQLRCIQCHDPHDPKFKGFHALPPPAYPVRAAGKPHPSQGPASVP